MKGKGVQLQIGAIGAIVFPSPLGFPEWVGGRARGVVMPMFDYVCPDCGAEFEELVRKSSEVILCPECGKSGCLRQLAKVAFSLGGDPVTPSTGSSSSCSGCSSTSCSSCSSGS